MKHRMEVKVTRVKISLIIGYIVLQIYSVLLIISSCGMRLLLLDMFLRDHYIHENDIAIRGLCRKRLEHFRSRCMGGSMRGSTVYSIELKIWQILESCLSWRHCRYLTLLNRLQKLLQKIGSRTCLRICFSRYWNSQLLPSYCSGASLLGWYSHIMRMTHNMHAKFRRTISESEIPNVAPSTLKKSLPLPKSSMIVPASTMLLITI